jgi:hypothetical protein
LKRFIFAVLGVLAVLFGILCILSPLYLFDGVGQGYTLKNVDKLVITVYALLAIGSFFVSYWLFRRSSKPQDSI